MQKGVWIVILMAFAGLCACSEKDVDAQEFAYTQTYQSMEPRVAEDILCEALDGDNPYDSHLDSVPQEGLVRYPVMNIGRLSKVFDDQNPLHLEAAEDLGIEPIESFDDIWLARRPLVRVKSCPEYYVDELRHSYPYLVPEAASLLSEIGRRFVDSLQAHGGGRYRMKVTSLLRTPSTVKHLRRVNRNSSATSAHQYATTFDISYSKFVCDGDGIGRTFEDLKNLLAEILNDLRRDGRCYVKYERRQACFHITVRALPDEKPVLK